MALEELDHAARRNTCTDRRRVPRIDDTLHVPSRFCLTDSATSKQFAAKLSFAESRRSKLLAFFEIATHTGVESGALLRVL